MTQWPEKQQKANFDPSKSVCVIRTAVAEISADTERRAVSRR